MTVVRAHDPGGKVRTKMGQDVLGSASFNAEGDCRFTLERWLEPVSRDYVLWIGMNPSTADAEVNDPTITREWGFTVGFRMNRMIKVNVSPYRATNPKGIVVDGLGDEYAHNEDEILRLAKEAQIVVLAHGVLPKIIMPYGDSLYQGLRRAGVPCRCLGRTKAGFARHPLYVPSNTPLVEYPL